MKSQGRTDAKVSASSSNNVLSNPSFRAILAGQALTQVCDKMTSVGLIWTITQSFGAVFVTWFLAASGLPHLLMTPLSSKAIARWGAFRLVILCDLMRALVYIALAFSLWLEKIVLTKGTLLCVVVITSTFAAFFNPAILTLPMQLSTRFSERQQLNSYLNTLMSAALAVGPALALLILDRLQILGIFFFTGAAYLMAAALSYAAYKNNQTLFIDDEFKDYPSLWHAFRSNPWVTALLIEFFLLNLLLGPLQLSFPIFAKSIYESGLNGLAMLETSLGVGLIVGGIAPAFLPGLAKPLAKALLALCVMATLRFGFALSSNLFIGCFSILGLGISLGFANSLLFGEFQSLPPKQAVPAVMSLVNLIALAGLPFSMLGTSFVIEEIGIRKLELLCCTLLFLASSLFFIALRPWRVAHGT